MNIKKNVDPDELTILTLDWMMGKNLGVKSRWALLQAWLEEIGNDCINCKLLIKQSLY